MNIVGNNGRADFDIKVRKAEIIRYDNSLYKIYVKIQGITVEDICYAEYPSRELAESAFNAFTEFVVCEGDTFWFDKIEELS